MANCYGDIWLPIPAQLKLFSTQIGDIIVIIVARYYYGLRPPAIQISGALITVCVDATFVANIFIDITDVGDFNEYKVIILKVFVSKLSAVS